MSSSKARRAQFIPCSKVLRAATSSSSLESSPDPKTVVHGVQASSRPQTSPLAAPCDKDVPLSLTSWISGVVTLVAPSGAACSWAAAAGSRRERTSLASAATGRGVDDLASPTTASATPVVAAAAVASVASAGWGRDATQLSLVGGGAGAAAVSPKLAAGPSRAAFVASAATAVKDRMATREGE
jgi:hypothetical protein